MSKARFRIALVVFSALLLACSDPPKEVEDTAVHAETAADKPEHFDLLSRPEDLGAFLRHEGGLIELRRGQISDLFPTNAERGFGFSEARGELIVSNSTGLVVNTPRLNAHTLQLTRIEGYAVLPPVWSDEARAENVAWLPTKSIPVSLKVLNKDEGYAEMSMDAPLTPGFYVLHDDSFIRARMRSEVSAYYPFVVTAAKGAELPLVSALRRCFDAAFLSYENAVVPLPDEEDLRAIRACATRHQLLMRMASTKAEVKVQLKEQLLFLQRVSESNAPALRNLLIESMNPNSAGLALWFWEQIQGDVLLKLTALHKKLAEGQALDPQMIADLYYYYYGEEKGPQSSLDALLWLPFYRVDGNNPYIGELFSKVTANRPWVLDLIELLGAIQIEKIKTHAQSNDKITNWYELFADEIPLAFREKAANLRLNPVGASAVIGPIFFSEVSKEQELVIRTALQARARELIACTRSLERRLGKRSAFFVFYLPLDTNLMGRDTASSMRDPIDQLRANPIVDPDFIACNKAVFDSIALPPALEPIQSVTFGITINTSLTAPWLK